MVLVLYLFAFSEIVVHLCIVSGDSLPMNSAVNILLQQLCGGVPNIADV